MTGALIDMATAREVHALAQARAESARADQMRCGTVSYRQGHRAQFWAGFEAAQGHTTAEAVPGPVLHESEMFAPKAYAQGQTDGYADGVALAISLGGGLSA